MDVKYRKRHEEVAEVVVRYILENGVEVGGKLPPERKLSELVNTSPVTLRRALKLLRDRGVLKSLPKSGTFLLRKPSPPATETDAAEVDETIDKLSPIALPSFHFKKSVTFFSSELNYPRNREMWRRIADLAEVELGDVKISFVESPVRRLISLDQIDMPDVILADKLDLRLLLSEKAVKSLPRDQVESVVPVNDLFPMTVNPFVDDGHLTAVPVCFCVAMTGVNENLIRSLDISVPRKAGCGATRRIIDRMDSLGVKPALSNNFDQYLLLQLLEDGVPVFDPDSNRVDLSSDEALETLKFNKKMFQRFYSFYQEPHIPDISHLWRDFRRGRIPMMWMYSHQLQPYPGESPFKLRLLPSNLSVDGACPSGVQALVFTKGPLEIEMALTIARVFTSPEAQRLIAQYKTNIPSLRTVAQSGDYLDGLPPETCEVVAAAENCEAIFHCWSIFQDQLDNLINRMCLSYYLEETELRSTVNEIQQLCDKRLKRAK